MSFSSTEALKTPKHEKERERLEALLTFEKKAYARGFTRVAGVDEVGRGPLAGPVVAAACILPRSILAGTFLEGIDDSKKLSPTKRASLACRLMEHPEVIYGIGVVEASLIDTINIFQATLRAMLLAVDNLSQLPDYLLVDGAHLPSFSKPAEAVIKGDARSQSIGAASIIAKHTRDQLMLEYHEKWPQYGFDHHKGYGTKEHLTALKKHGACPLHRKSFGPVKEVLVFS